MNILKTLMIATVASMVSMPVFAHQYGHHGYSGFDKRVERQESRIRQGVKSGELTRKEAGKLRAQQKNIAKLERKLSRDGLIRHERKKLNKRQAKASETIYRLKHNAQSRGQHRKHHRLHQGHLYSWYKKPYSRDYGYRLSGDDRWTLVLRLSDHF